MMFNVLFEEQENTFNVDVEDLQLLKGDTPVKGVDYFTEADKQEFINRVKESLNTETWSFTLEDGSVIEKKVLLA